MAQTPTTMRLSGEVKLHPDHGGSPISLGIVDIEIPITIVATGVRADKRTVVEQADSSIAVVC